MRRILLTLAVALFSVAAPAAPASASTTAPRHPHPPHPNPLALAREAMQDHRQFLDTEAASALHAFTSQLHLSLGQLVQKWQRVAICEVDGNWAMKGPMFSGIGFSNATWLQYGGARFAPSAGDATPLQQVAIAMRITRTWIPDQYGCSPFGW